MSDDDKTIITTVGPLSPEAAAAAAAAAVPAQDPPLAPGTPVVTVGPLSPEATAAAIAGAAPTQDPPPPAPPPAPPPEQPSELATTAILLFDHAVRLPLAESVHLFRVRMFRESDGYLIAHVFEREPSATEWSSPASIYWEGVNCPVSSPEAGFRADSESRSFLEGLPAATLGELEQETRRLLAQLEGSPAAVLR